MALEAPIIAEITHLLLGAASTVSIATGSELHES
jgi:hypothetical protein